MPLSYRNIYYWCLLLSCWGAFSCASANKNKSSEIAKTPAPAQTYRAEVESNSFDDEHWVHPLPDSSLLLVSLKRSSWFSKAPFIITKYDKQLKQVLRVEHEQKSGSNLYKIASDRNKAYLLFAPRDPKRLQLYQVDLSNGSYVYSEHVMPSSNFNIKEMKVLQGQIFLYALEHIKLNMLLLDPSKEELRQLPAVFGLEDDLGEFRVDTISNAVEFVVAESNGWRSRLQTKRMNASGDVIGTYFLQPNMQYRDDNTLQIARLTPGDTLQKLLIGTYGYRTSMFARGLFSSDLTGNIKYYDFSQLEYFFEYTSPRRQRKMKAKFARQEAKGKPLVLRYRLLLHPIMPHPLGYAIVGEVYYPQYRSYQYTTASGNPNFGNGPHTRQIYDGFRFTHAIACVFDRQGNLLWDNSFRLSNATYPELAPTVEAGITPNGDITLVYPKEEHLHYKTLKPGTSLSNEENVPIKLKEETEKLVSSDQEGIVQWYGSHFISFGFQRIRPADGSARSVFFLQEVVYE
ncbi:hypothetical protein [Rufibacter roseus]|uniref:Uncharacterized protein n=1 Tax=Rufibacter roseus TaxID=1567108 RepID=A0ABW2DPI3_9BACT|nr:hypothetical protein [Rufibacter roseus]